MKFLAGFVAGVCVALIGQAQVQQAEQHRVEVECDLRPASPSCR